MYHGLLLWSELGATIVVFLVWATKDCGIFVAILYAHPWLLLLLFVAKLSLTFATPWTLAHQAPLSMGFSRQEYLSGLPSPGDLPDPGIEPESPAWQLGIFLHIQFSSVTQLCPTLCYPMDCSTPGFPVHHQLPKLVQSHVHWVGDAIETSYPLSSPSPPAFNLSQYQGLIQCQFFTSGNQSTGVSASALPMNIQDWFPLGWTGWISMQS